MQMFLVNSGGRLCLPYGFARQRNSNVTKVSSKRENDKKITQRKEVNMEVPE